MSEEKKQSISERLEKKQPKGKICSICSAPRYVSFQEKDEETGKVVTREHLVECIGHQGVPGRLWNLHRDYDEYKRWEVRHHAETCKPSKKQ